MNRILKGQPWHFSGHIFVLIESTGTDQISAEDFQYIPFWIQIHGIPLRNISSPLALPLGERIANSIGKFLEFDPSRRHTFLRLRVLLNSSQPLSRGIFLNLDKEKDNIWVSFRFERLSTFCYYCGFLDHFQNDCGALRDAIDMGFNPTLQYDETLKTSGLTNMIPIASSISPLAYGLKKKSMAQAALSYAQPLSSDSLVKRQKMGKIGENSTSSNRQSGTEIAIGNMKSSKQKEISLDNDKNTSTQTKKPHKETYMPTPQAVFTISFQEVPVHNEGKVQNPKA